MKRQRGRGRKSGNPANRSLESNGPEVKIRGTAAQIYDKYMQYARDAQTSGDRIRAENLFQHAEHYYRIMAANMPKDRQPQQQDDNDAQRSDAPAVEDASNDALKVVDDVDAGAAAADADEAAAEAPQPDASGEDAPKPRRRRAPRRKQPAEASSADSEARSALDSLAEEQGEFAQD